MEALNHDVLMIAAVVSGVVAGHRLRNKSLLLLSCLWMAIFIAVSPAGFAAFEWKTTLVAAAAFAASVLVGRTSITSLLGGK